MIAIFERHVSKWRLFLFLCEFVLILGALYLVKVVLYLTQWGINAYALFDAAVYLPQALLIVVVCQVCMYLNELYDYKVVKRRGEFIIHFLQSIGFSYIVLSLVYFIDPDMSLGQGTCIFGLPLIILLLFAWRITYSRVLGVERLAEKVLILGSSPLARSLMQEIAEVQDSGYKVVALVVEEDQCHDIPDCEREGVTIVPMREFPSVLRTTPVDRIVVALRERRGTLPTDELLAAKFRGIHVEEARNVYESLTGKIAIEDLHPSWFIFSEGFKKSALTLRIKRLTDIVAAAIGIAVASPVMLVFGVLIKLDSKGPVLYTQDRVGEGWKDFTLYKFRSMVQHAEASGPQWAQGDKDPRVTRVGRFMRKYRIDEIPQLINVLKGDLSFVGPRPERRYFVDTLAQEIPFYPQRLCVKPGVTGWAQIKYQYTSSKTETIEKLQYDLYYIKHLSFFFDLSIIFDTIRVVLSGKG